MAIVPAVRQEREAVGEHNVRYAIHGSGPSLVRASGCTRQVARIQVARVRLKMMRGYCNTRHQTQDATCSFDYDKFSTILATSEMLCYSYRMLC
jgi:hypothetical protein